MRPSRFDRQTRFQPLGVEGQARLEAGSVLVVGCGALGGVLAQSMVRAGVGRVVLVDRDIVELSNLPRQVLFDERHAREATPKAHAARETLERVGGPSVIEAHATQLDTDNVEEFVSDVDLVLDGTDNLRTRYLLNDVCVRDGRPWVYAGVVGASGLTLPVIPGRGACLRCVFPEPPPAAALATCETAGVLLPAVAAVASLAAGFGLRLLAAPAGLEPALFELDVWHGSVRRVSAPRDPECPTCAHGEFPFLEDRRPDPVALCGRNTVQIPRPRVAPDLEALAKRLERAAERVERRGPLLRFEAESFHVTVFGDGRALVEGTDDIERARAIYDRYLGV